MSHVVTDCLHSIGFEEYVVRFVNAGLDGIQDVLSIN